MLLFITGITRGNIHIFSGEEFHFWSNHFRERV